MALPVSSNREKLIMLLVDYDNDGTVIECNDTSKLSHIKMISLRPKANHVYTVTNLTSAVEVVKEYYK